MKKSLCAVLLLVSLFSASPAIAEGDTIHVFYAGPEGAVRTAIGLSDSFRMVQSAAEADVLVLNGALDDPEAIAEMVRSGKGLILLAGPDLTPEDVGHLFGIPVTLEKKTDPLSLTNPEDAQDQAIEEIVWNSAPQIRERSILKGPTLDPIVIGYPEPSPVLSTGYLGKGQVFYFAGFLDGANPQIQDWPYFNYLFYQITSRAAGQPALSFGRYPASPVPHARERNVLFACLAAILLSAWTIFFFVRRYSMAHPEALDVLVSHRDDFLERQAETDWEDVGFHRPLGGFLIALTLALIVTVPMMIYSTMVFRVYILPSAQAIGIYDRVTQFFSLIWVVFDVGTSVVFIKFFSQYRVHDPARAVKYGQFFIWWQALTGTIQIALVTVVAGIWMPHTAYALYAWIAIAHCMIQIPGFYSVFRLALASWQRFDYCQIMDLAAAVVLPLLSQPLIVISMVAWGKAHPAIGGSMGGMYGMAVAGYASQVLYFVFGYLLYRRLGYDVKVLFLAHFDLKIVKEAFKFGVFEMLGSAAYTFGQAMEIVITTAFLINYNEIWGNWGLAWSLAGGTAVGFTLYGNLMPAISEAISSAKIKLSQYYAAMAMKWGGLLTGFYTATLLAVVDRFILGTTGPEFERAAEYAFPLIIFMALPFPTLVNDSIALASNRPYLKTFLTIGEHTIRITLALLLIRRFQIYALIYAYMVALMSKNIMSYIVVNRYCFPQRFYFWQTLGAPFSAGVVHFFILRWITGLIWQGDQVTSLLIYLIGLLGSFPIYGFFYGAFGGWDEDGLMVFRRAVDNSSFIRPAAWVLWKSTSAGARISPLNNRFPIGIYQEAMEEARALTAERVALIKSQKVALKDGPAEPTDS